MNFRDVAAILCNDPFGMTPAEVGQLTPWQVANLYLCERDRSGAVVLANGPGAIPTPEEWFRRHWELQGLEPWQIDKLWHECQALGGE